MLLDTNLPTFCDSCARKSCLFFSTGAVKREDLIFWRAEMSSVRQEGNSATSSGMLIKC